MKNKDERFNSIAYLGMGTVLIIILDTAWFSHGGWTPLRMGMYAVMTLLIVTMVVKLVKLFKDGNKESNKDKK